jgi:hypothetical protein
MEPGPRTAWINEDIAPTPIREFALHIHRHEWCSDVFVEMRVWTWFSFVSLWWSQNYGAGSWSTGAALINAGLTVNQALGVSALGCILTSLVGVSAAVSHH